MPPARLDRNEVADVIANVLLHGVARAQMHRDFGIDLVPRAADLTLEIAPQRRQVLVELLPAAGDAVRPPHALIPGQVLKRPGGSGNSIARQSGEPIRLRHRVDGAIFRGMIP